MFNEEIKKAFIREYTTSISHRKTCADVFKVTEKYENEWGSDIFTKSADDLQQIVDELAGIRGRSIRVTILQDYVKWCIDNNIPGTCMGMLQVDTSGVEKMKHQTVNSPLHLQTYLNQVFDPESEETIDNIYRCFYWLAYSGMTETDIFNVKSNEVDFLNMIVNHDNKEYPIYREAIPAFKNCVYLTQFLYKHPNYSSDKVVYKDRAEGDVLIRAIRSVPSVTVTRVELSRRSKLCIEEHKTTLKLSYYRVFISGLFYRIYEKEKAGIPVDFTEAADRFIEGKTYNWKKNRMTPETYKRKVMGDYLRDYNRWKMTFM